MARLDQKRRISKRGSNVKDDISDVKSEVNEYSDLSPKDAFQKFDTDDSGDIDELEFFHLLQSIGIKGNEQYQERLFRRYVKSGSKTIDYVGFKSVWLLLGNPKQELIDGEVKDLPKFATRYQLVRLLEKVLGDEERLDTLAKAEEDRYRMLRDRKHARAEYIRKAQARAGLELGRALDAAGVVYVLGKGAHGQFGGAPKKDMSTLSFQQAGSERLQSLWEERVERVSHGANSNTAGIWGRQPRKIAMTDNTILAVTAENGILSWGGTFNWHNLNDQPMQAATPMQSTPRSSALLMNNERMHQKHLSCIQEEIDEKDAKSLSEIERMEVALRYYCQWPFHFDATNDIEMVKDHLIANVSHDQLLHSLLLRGKPCEGNGLSKLQMGDILSKDVCLEKELLGEAGHQELYDIEMEIVDLTKRNKTKSADSLRLKFAEKWVPLAKAAKKRAIEKENRQKDETRAYRIKQNKEYEIWNGRKFNMQHHSITKNDGLMAGSITARGGDIRTPRGVSQYLDIAAGSNHAALTVRDERSRGSLYTWGSGSLGRLGQGNGEDMVRDRNYPELIKELKGVSVQCISLGGAHSAAVSKSGHLFVWGAGSSGQLGFSEMPNSQGYCCPVPTRLLIPCIAAKVSCGACHTACVGKSGELYVWGLGDGGRLGLGRNRMITQYTPTVVESLCHETAVDVSCGTSTTLVLTETTHSNCNSRTSTKTITGGRLYVAGPTNILGNSCFDFSELEYLKQNPIVIKSISAGFSHQAFISGSGELYCWGNNINNCCGKEKSSRFLAEPTKVDWLYKAPKNMALGKPCRLSTLYKDSEGLSARNAVDGNIDGNSIKTLAHSQFEAQPYLDIDLGSFVQITNVRLWNRTDEPDDCALQIDMFSKRLFPCYVMISQFPFPSDLEGKEGLHISLTQSVAKVRFSDDKRMSNWRVPKFTTGRYVRVQLEETNFLNFAQMEVFGWEDEINLCGGPVSSCSAGKFVTAAVVMATEDRTEISAAYKRAINADFFNAEILRQLSTYCNEYTKEQNSFDSKAECLICVGNKKCEICSLKSKFKSELHDVINGKEPYRLSDLASYLLSASNIERSNPIKITGEEKVDEGDGVKTKNILPVLLKLKKRASIARRKKTSMLK